MQRMLTCPFTFDRNTRQRPAQKTGFAGEKASKDRQRVTERRCRDMAGGAATVTGWVIRSEPVQSSTLPTEWALRGARCEHRSD